MYFLRVGILFSLFYAKCSTNSFSVKMYVIFFFQGLRVLFSSILHKMLLPRVYLYLLILRKMLNQQLFYKQVCLFFLRVEGSFFLYFAQNAQPTSSLLFSLKSHDLRDLLVTLNSHAFPPVPRSKTFPKIRRYFLSFHNTRSPQSVRRSALFFFALNPTLLLPLPPPSPPFSPPPSADQYSQSQ